MITEKDCPFCDEKQMSSKQLYTTPSAFVIEPLNPVVPGHRLAIPNTHISPRHGTSHIEDCVQALEEYRALEGIFNDDFNLIVNAGETASQSIEHMHVHYIPRRKDDGLQLPWTDQQTKKNDIRCRHCGEVIVEVETNWYQGQRHYTIKKIWTHAYSGRTGCANFPEATP